MNIEDQITALLAEAEPLRYLPIEEQGALAGIVDRINALRAIQGQAQDAQAEADFAEVVESVAPKRRGRKAVVEGADA